MIYYLSKKSILPCMIDVDIEGVESVMRILHYDSDDQSIPLVFLDQILLDPNRFQ